MITRFVRLAACVFFAFGMALPAPVRASTGEPPAVSVPVQSAGAAAGMEGLFAEGNALYEKGDFDGAIRRYRALVDEGVEQAGLYYNLANAHYKAGELGRAVLNYERALRIAPRDRDARENLALLRSQLRDKQFVREQNRVVAAVVWLHHNLTTREMLALASTFYLLSCLLAIVFVFRDSAPVSAVYRRLSVVSPGRLAGFSRSQDLLAAVVVAALLFVSTGASAFGKWTRESRGVSAVVLDPEVPVYSGPMEDATLQFKVHEGTVLRIDDERKGWMRIELPGGLSGWTVASAVERI